MEASKPYLAMMSKEVCTLASLALLRLPLLLRRGLPLGVLDRLVRLLLGFLDVCGGLFAPLTGPSR
jgi:hypothetical protein